MVNRLLWRDNSSGFWGMHYSSRSNSQQRRVAAISHEAAVGSVSVCLTQWYHLSPLVVEGAGDYTFWVNWFFVFLAVFSFFSSPLHPTRRFIAFTLTTFFLDAYYLCFLFLCPFSHMPFLMIPLAQHNLSPLYYIFTYYLYSSRVSFQVKRFPPVSFSDWLFTFSRLNFLQGKY